MLTKVRVIAVNPEKQTVDIISTDKFQAFVAGDESTRGYIERNIPYLSSNPTNNTAPYIIGALATVGINQDFKDALWQYGQSFNFGRTYNPVYLKFVNELYYKKKGTNIKAVSGGEVYRPQEGSIALYDPESRTIIGFLNGYAKTSQALADYSAPDIGVGVDEFSPDYIDNIRDPQSKDINEILRYLHTSIGYDPSLQPTVDTPTRNRKSRKLIDHITGDDFYSATMPVTSPYVYKQDVNLAHPEELSEQFIKYKKNSIKRVNDIFDLSTNGAPNRAVIFSTYNAENSDSKLFDGEGEFFNPQLHTISSNNLSLQDKRIYENYLSWEEIQTNIERLEKSKPKGVPESNKIPYKDFAYDGEDIHIVPESGFKHNRDGGLILYADVTNSFADNTKPISIDEYITDSSFYNENNSYIDYIDAFVEKFNSDFGVAAITNDNYLYAIDDFSTKSPLIRNSRLTHGLDDRGSFLKLEPEFIEISSDTEKGGWLLEKSNKSLSWAREYEKHMVFMPYDAFKKLINERDLTNPPCLNFDHRTGFAYEVYSDDRIREGTYSVESPLITSRSYREYHKSIQSYAVEVKESEKYGHYTGLYMGTMSTNSEDNNPLKGESVSNVGGYILLSAGKHSAVGGNSTDVRIRPEENAGGIIELDAHEIRLNANRIMMGQVRVDQRERVNDLNFGALLLAMIPIEGAIATKIADLLRENFPVRNKPSLENIL